MNNISAIFRIIKQLMYILSPGQKRRSVVVFLSMLAVSCLELLGVSSIFPLIQLMITPGESRDKWYVGWIYIINPNISYEMVIFVFSMLIVIIFLLKNVLAIVFLYMQYRFAAEFRRESSTQMLRKYMRRSYEFFINTNSSIVLRGINNDTTSAYQILIDFFQLAGELLTISMLAVFLLSMDTVLAISALILAGACLLLIVGVFKRKMKEIGRESREASSLQTKCSYQAINGIKEISVLGRKEIFISQYEKAARHYAECGLINNVISSCPERILEGICVSGFVIIVCVRVMMSGDAELIVPVLGSFAMGAFKILPSISKFSGRINDMVFHQFGLQNCYDIFKEAERIDSEEKVLGIETDGDEKVHEDFKESIKIDHISWRYKNSQSDVLEDLSMEIRKGESVAFIGSSGAGKTTLADIIMGLLKPQNGSVYMDGNDIFLIPHTWHKQIGYVPQAVYLIDDTIRANVAFGLPSDMVDDEQVWSALEQAQFKDFVKDLSDGLDTIVGERGVKFSGGQRQRIALARALYENPSILVLDEATSALDNETESTVMESIEKLQGHKTLIIIAHRLTTIRSCDKIYEIADGKALEKTHEDVFGE